MTSNHSISEFPDLKPKSSLGEHTSMSRIHVSKNWTLPPRIKSRGTSHRKKLPTQLEGGSRNILTDGDVNTFAHNTPPSDKGSPNMGKSDSERKKIQNRDAQRAYRERRANKLKVLEDAVDSLQQLVKKWQRKYKETEKELQQYKETLELSLNENKQLKESLTASNNGLVCSICLQPIEDPSPQRSEVRIAKPSRKTGRVEKVSVENGTEQNKRLHHIISNFKPMKAEMLKKAIGIGSFSGSSGVLSKLPTTTGTSDQVEKSVTFPNRDLAKNENMATTTPNKCGFCEEGSRCVCNELEAAEEMTQKLSTNASEKLSGHCQSSPNNCTKCSNIDETCIKPISPTPSYIPETEVSSQQMEIDFNQTPLVDNFQKIRKYMQ